MSRWRTRTAALNEDAFANSREDKYKQLAVLVGGITAHSATELINNQNQTRKYKSLCRNRRVKATHAADCNQQSIFSLSRMLYRLARFATRPFSTFPAPCFAPSPRNARLQALPPAYQSEMTNTIASATEGMQPPLKQAKTEPMFRVKKLSDAATIPSRGSAGAAGYDISR